MSIYPPRPLVNNNATTAEDWLDLKIATGELIPIVYGRARVAGKIAAVKSVGNYIHFLAVFCLGEIDSFEKFYINDNEETPEASYLGTTTQTADPTMQSVFSGYADTLVLTDNGNIIGAAYAVFKLPVSIKIKSINAIIKGKKVYDPRTTTTVWSDNAALCLSDFIESTAYGQGKTVDDASLTTLANFHDEILVGTTKRSQLNLVINKIDTVLNWRETIRAYAQCFIIDNDPVEFLPNKTTASQYTLSDSDVIDITVSKKSLRNNPNRVRVKYTNIQTDPWSDETVEVETSGVTAGTESPVISEIQLPGLTSYSQAYQVAELRLNESQISDTKISFSTFDESLKNQPGDVFTITNQNGLTAEEFRVISTTATTQGRWKIEAETYSDLLYSTTPQAEPVFSDVTDDNTYINAEIGILAPLEAEIFFNVIDNKITRARIIVTWDAANFNIGDASPDGLVVFSATSKYANRIKIADNNMKIDRVEILDEGTYNVIDPSYANKVQIFSTPANTGTDLAGMWWMNISSVANGESDWKKVVKYDVYNVYPRDPFSFVPAAPDVVNYAQVAFRDTRTSEYRLGFCEGEIIRWDKIDYDPSTNEWSFLNVTRGAEGTTPVDMTGKYMDYFPATGPGTTINVIPLSAFEPDSTGLKYIGEYEILIDVPADMKWYGMSCMFFHNTIRKGNPSTLRSYIVPFVYGGAL